MHLHNAKLMRPIPRPHHPLSLSLILLRATPTTTCLPSLSYASSLDPEHRTPLPVSRRLSRPPAPAPVAPFRPPPHPPAPAPSLFALDAAVPGPIPVCPCRPDTSTPHHLPPRAAVACGSSACNKGCWPSSRGGVATGSSARMSGVSSGAVVGGLELLVKSNLL